MECDADETGDNENIVGFDITEPSEDSASYIVDDLVCIKCRDPDSSREMLREVGKGINALVSHASKFGNDVLLQHLKNQQAIGGKVRIHEQCQRDIYNDLKRKDTSEYGKKGKVPRLTRSSLETFKWKENCFFCGKVCMEDKKHPKRQTIMKAATLPFRTKVLEICSKRMDDWSKEVHHRVLDCHDFVAAEARYHKSCYIKFSLKNTETSTPGRPVESKKSSWFNMACDWLESEAELHSLGEIHEKMLQLSDNDNVYSPKWLKTKLVEKYGENIFFADVNGRADVVCFREMAKYLVNDKWFSERKENPEDEGERIIKLATKLILGDIRAAEFDCSQYPSTEEISDVEHGLQWLPRYLKKFLKGLLKSDLKQVSIGQAIVQSTRPRSSLSPVLFGLAVELDHLFGSKWLLTELNKLGFCLGPEEVNRFKQSVVETENISSYLKDNMTGAFTQWSADNVDHNVRTLDGTGTLHAMGIIASSTGGENTNTRKHYIKRQKRKLVRDVIINKGIKLLPYVAENVTGLSKVYFKGILELQQPITLPPDINMDFLWHSLYFVKHNERPGWSGYMTDVSTGNYPGKSAVHLLPIIDLDPTNMSCIYSTIVFVIEQAKELQLQTPVLTFDQPLWLKATEIVNAKSLSVVLILGGFHLLMSFCGSIGKLMNGSGLKEALQVIYGVNTVEHMLTGKAISKALRGHFTVESALTIKLMRKYFPEKCSDELNEEEHCEVDNEDSCDSGTNHLKMALQSVNNDPESGKELIENSNIITNFKELLDEYKDNLSSSSRTARLWIQYLDYINTVKLFIRAARTGNWSLHLESVRKMLNLLAGTGHIHYAKSARLYLQNMLELPKCYPWVYERFIADGFHIIRRSDRFWAGLWSDLVIEQVLMRSLKSRGGLTRGRGVTESVRIMWTNSMHRCADVHNAMTTLTGHEHRTSEQHIELNQSRLKRDNTDLQKIISFFQEHDPFDISEPHLKCLVSGLTATDMDNINCDNAEDIGAAIQSELDSICFEAAKLKRSDQLHTLGELQPGVKLDNKIVHIDPCILFARVTAILSSEDNIAQYFEYELTPEPTSLFKDSMMRKPTKSVLRNALLNQVESIKEIDCKTCVIDGGALLHKVWWPPKSTYRDVFNQYTAFVARKYGKYDKVFVVFDGYTKTTTKNQEQLRRGSSAANVTVMKDCIVSSTREIFLRNGQNKQQFIEILTECLKNAGSAVYQSESDADILIVKTALGQAVDSSVIVYADDTDILVLLCYHWNSQLGGIYFATERSEKTDKSKQLKYWDISSINTSISYKDQILFAHAWSGCDTTSSIYQQGKTKLLRQLESDHMKEMVEYFGSLNADQDDIVAAGCQVFINSYGGKSDDTLGELRYTKYMQIITTASALQPERLPPTTNAARYHSLRVHLQVCQWKHLDLDILDPTKWGWKIEDAFLIPVATDLPPAPECILKFIRCNCKVNSRNPCGTHTCTCQKNGIKCVTACGDCRGVFCNNAQSEENSVESSDDEFDDTDRNIFDIFD